MPDPGRPAGARRRSSASARRCSWTTPSAASSTSTPPPCGCPSPDTPASARPGCSTCPNWSRPPGWWQPGQDGEFSWIEARAEWAPPRTLRAVRHGGRGRRRCPCPPPGEWIYAWAWEDEAAGRVRARAFPGRDDGIDEDEATGAAALLLTAPAGPRPEHHPGRGLPDPHGTRSRGASSGGRRPGVLRNARPSARPSGTTVRRSAGTPRPAPGRRGVQRERPLALGHDPLLLQVVRARTASSSSR